MTHRRNLMKSSRWFAAEEKWSIPFDCQCDRYHTNKCCLTKTARTIKPFLRAAPSKIVFTLGVALPFLNVLIALQNRGKSEPNNPI
jgi:hypothetical protein